MPRSADGRRTRQERIVAALHDRPRVDVGGLAGELGVTAMTIRRDLAELDAAGRLDRVHGGAKPARPPVFEDRAAVRVAEKLAVARGVEALLPRGSCVALDIGTTCEAVARRLAPRDDLVVITYSLPAALAMRNSRSRVVMLGGVLTDDLSVVGDVAPVTSAMHIDAVVLGCAGISAEHGLTYFDPDEVAVRRGLVDASDRVVVAADADKIGAHAAFRLGAADLADDLVTDSGADRSVLRALGARPHHHLVVA